MATANSDGASLVPVRPMFYGMPDPIVLNRMELLVNEVRTLQRERLDKISRIDPRRDFNAECGYPEHGLSPEEYKDLVDTEPVAELVNAIYPLESWKTQPKIYDSDDPSDVTPFMEAWDSLPQMLGIEPSYHVQDTNNVIWPFLLNADILAGIGRYGIILLGVDDGQQDLSQPLLPRKGMKLTYLQAFPEHLAKISSFETNQNSPRVGMPVQYQVSISDPYDSSRTDINEPYTTRYVHWSRVIHITDHWHTACPSRVFGVPRIRPVLHPILDIKKVRGSSAEMYYKGAFIGLHFGTHPQLGPDVDVKTDDLRDMYEEYVNGLQRAIWTSGMFVDPLAPQVVDPTPQIAVQLEAISIKMRTPKRVLMGSERGELSSADDRKDYNGKLMSRQNLHNAPKIAAPFANRLINLGILPAPRKPGYRLWWPDLASLSELEKADILTKRTQAYASYVSGGVEAVVPPRAFMTGFDQLSDEEADAILGEAMERMEGEPDTTAPLLGLVGGVDAMLQMFDRFSQGAISEETLKQLIMLFYKVREDKAEEIIADGLPEPPAGSERDLPPLPAFKGPNAVKGPIAKTTVVANWLTDNVFCATGPGGGIDPTCSPGGGKGTKSKGVKGRLAKLKDKISETILDTVDGLVDDYTTPIPSSPVAMLGSVAEKLGGVNHDNAMAVGVAMKLIAPAVLPRISKGLEWIDNNLYTTIDDSPPEVKSGLRQGTKNDPIAPVPSKKTYNPSVEAKDKDGITKAARVGVPAKAVPPPPALKSLPNLTPREREVEQRFLEKVAKDPDGIARKFREIVTSSTKPGDPPTFGTDDAKVLHPAWHADNLSLQERSQNRATLNTPLHQAANAIAKRAFVQHLDTLKPGDEILVTVGGCGAGKGYALKQIPDALALKSKSKAVWDSAGDQNATENPWIRELAKERGLKVNYLFVHADPFKQWSDPERGVVKRAGDPNDGRMVDAKVFADSYAIGARNHQSFYNRYKKDKDLVFFFIDNTGKPVAIPGIPPSALNLDRKALAKFAIEEVDKIDVPEHVKRGATMGTRIWKD